MRLSFQTTNRILQQLPTNHWLSLDKLNDFELSDRLVTWLSHVGSMTRFIKSHTDAFRLEVLTAGPQRADTLERQLLNLAKDKPTYIREVKMSADNQAWLFGRSIFPLDLVNSDNGAVQTLGETPLGRLLYAQEGQPRLSIEVALLDRSNPLIQRLDCDGPLYARRSIFRYHSDKVLVQEIFLEEHPVYSI
jgi:chorismate--pyruvate lyase